MSATTAPVDTVDGLIADDVGRWASEKHERIKKYIDASRGARAGFLPPRGTGGASYIELFAGSGRSRIRETGQFVDGSPLVAIKAARASGAPFSELHLNDLDPEKAAALKTRLEKLGASAVTYTDAAETAVGRVVAALNPYGLHFAFLDPYNLEQLPFSIIEKLARVHRMDMLMHVSVQDLQRNLGEHVRPGGVLDKFIPNWRDDVDENQSLQALRAGLLKCWLERIRSLGMTPSEGIELVSGGKNQRLYWLVFVNRHDLGQKLWNAVRDVSGQADLGF